MSEWPRYVRIAADAMGYDLDELGRSEGYRLLGALARFGG